MACESTSLSCRQCGKKSFCTLTQLQQEQSRVKKGFSFISDISDVSYNIRLTKTGQLATLLYSRLAHKGATGNSAYFHTLQIFIQSCFVLQKNRCMRKELKSLSRRPNIRQNVVQTFRQFFPHPSLILKCEASNGC
jgi:hypothetical protein